MTPAPEGGTGAALLEREHALRRVSAAITGAERGNGSALLIEAAPGLGKTALLDAACGEAAAAGLLVRRALGGELEQMIAWGVAREVLAADVRRAGSDASAAVRAACGLVAAPVYDTAVQHGFTELCGDLGAARGLLVAVDDAHWADRPSAAWLSYLAVRAREMPVVTLVCARPQDPRRPPELLTLGGGDGVELIELAPLSAGASCELVRRLWHGVDSQWAAECHRATGGNPFLLTELARELSAAGEGEPAEIVGAQVSRIDRTVARRLNACGADADTVAEAVAILGGAATAGDVASLAGLPDSAVLNASDALRAAGLFAQQAGTMTFAHPLVRSAVLRAVPPGRASTRHLAAARHLHVRDGPSERVPAHLMNVEPGSDAWVRGRLVEAAEAALNAGAPRSAIALLERALAERAESPADASLRASLGRAALRVDPVLATAQLRRAYDSTSELGDRVGLALDLAVGYQTTQRVADAVELLDALSAELRAADAPRAWTLRIEAELLAQAFFDPNARRLRTQRLGNAVATLDGTEPAERLIIVQQGIQEAHYGTASRTRELAERAWGGGDLRHVAGSLETPALMWVPYLRMYVDDVGWTIDLMHEWLREAARTGSPILAALAHGVLSDAFWRGGALADAEAAAHAGWAVARDIGPQFPGWWISLAALIQAQIARGEPETALATLRDHDLADGPPPEIMLVPLMRAVRAEAKLATGATREAAHELTATWEWIEREGAPSPGCWRFPGTLVDALLALDQHSDARDVARTWLSRTRAFGTRSTFGIAQRALGLATGGRDGLELLAAAESTLAASTARVEHARAQLELGAALRRANRRRDSREPLRKALDTATRLGAATLAERARTELQAAGARPRRTLLSGADALTPSERRVAQLAANGLTNREIAAALFVTRKTVERHLGQTYLKLGTNHRDQLGPLLNNKQLDAPAGS